MEQLDLAYYWTLPCAGAVCFVVGFLFGLPALRLQGLYLALATFALATAMPQILKFQPLEPLTGGVHGIVILKPAAWCTARRRPVALFLHIGGVAVDVRLRKEPGEKPHGPRNHGDPRPPDRRRVDGDQHRAL
jgi:ABC-type branched-subunit amino acid transport system permease subunit